MSPRIKIMHIRDSRGIYGADRVVLALARCLNRERFEFVLVCLRSPDGLSDQLINAARNMGVTVEVVPVKRRVDLAAVKQLRALLKKHSVSILHAHDFKTTFHGLLASVNLPIKRVATAHGATRDSLRMKAYLFLDERVVYRFFDKVVAVAGDVFDDLTQKGVNPRKIELILNGIDLSSIESDHEPARPMSSRQPNGQVFGVVGRLYPDKGHRFFLEAFRNVVRDHPSAKALVVGGGPLHGELADQIRHLQLEKHVALCGPRSDIQNVYRQLDVVVLPSLREGLPYVLLEALASRIPVIATAVGDIPRLIQHERTGFLVPAGSAESLETYMRRVLTRPDEARQMAQEGSRLVAEQYSASRMARQTELLYDSLVNLEPRA